ncbi:GNAT family N-acetyltransferase [Viridibacillus arvi]|uniref:GNAT family N-acetyltransferase n=1 Tax=Viridibacillus arvi TaxID=263475 RepID=UPI00187BA259|nr:GNAT family N-acetyltransferase [Viridibacillus sp. JNUCC-6]QOV11251.1 GNAT family N-acetyltransferase [Viridibacillus sp. JNUCC-6]
MSVYLERYSNRYKSQIECYQLTDEQLQFTGSPVESIFVAKSDEDRYPILVLDDEEIVSYFVLHMNEGVSPYSNNQKAILLRTFSTDYRYQGRGYAKQSLLELPKFVKMNFSDITEVVLAVNVKNIAAQSLYLKCGFIDEGARIMGSHGELIIMSLKINGVK